MRITVRKILSALCRRRLPFEHTIRIGDATATFSVTVNVERFRVVDFGGERELLERTLPLVQPTDVVWDIGSNVGVNALLYASRGAQVVAFEPEPEICAKLETNVKMNPTLRVTVQRVALSDTDGEMALSTEGLDGRSPRLHDPGAARTVHVSTRRGDGMIASGVPAPTVLKVDVEGAEGRVFAGLADALANPRLRLCVLELHPVWLPRFGDSVESVRAALTSAGLRPLRSDERSRELHEVWTRSVSQP